MYLKILILFMMMLSIGCASVHKKSMMVDSGMKKSEVLKIMGYPVNRQFKGNKEALQWCSTGFAGDDFVLIWFEDKQVTGINTYNNHATGPCSAFVRTVRWSDAPKLNIEIKNTSNEISN